VVTRHAAADPSAAEDPRVVVDPIVVEDPIVERGEIHGVLNAAQIEVRNAVENEARNAVQDAVQAEVRNGVRNGVQDEARSAVPIEVRNGVQDEVPIEVRNEVGVTGVGCFQSGPHFHFVFQHHPGGRAALTVVRLSADEARFEGEAQAAKWRLSDEFPARESWWWFL
jgi:hypothetical protein